MHCDGCGEPIADKSAPCPKCGSSARVTLLGPLIGVARGVGEAQLRVGEYPERLLGVCRDLIERGEFGIAVVVAHIACEMVVEQAFGRALADPHVRHLEERIRKSLNGYSLQNDINRGWYKALTGDDISKTGKAFWKAYAESVELRDAVVHRGVSTKRADAEACCKAAQALIEHVSLQPQARHPV